VSTRQAQWQLPVGPKCPENAQQLLRPRQERRTESQDRVEAQEILPPSLPLKERGALQWRLLRFICGAGDAVHQHQPNKEHRYQSLAIEFRHNLPCSQIARNSMRNTSRNSAWIETTWRNALTRRCDVRTLGQILMPLESTLWVPRSCQPLYSPISTS
jgi:hypothetical protein